MKLPAKQRWAATHATSRQTNTGALALWDCVRMDGRMEVTSCPNQNFLRGWA